MLTILFIFYPTGMFYLVYGALYVISLLPLRVLYLLSDFAFFVLYRVVGYRKKVVYANLQQAFPTKTEEERHRIAKKFYRNFTDSFIEFIKLMSASPRYILKHFHGDYSLPARLYAEKKRCQVLLSHNFNWEWACLAIQLEIKQIFLVVYMPITNKVVDRIFIKVRSRTHSALVPATDISRAIMPFRKKIYMLGLVADQNPGDPAGALWFQFFGRPTPFVSGPENGARRGDIPVLFCKFLKERRGYYRVHIELLEEHPASLPPGELTRKYVRKLEEFISQYPEQWLWSHRRWKWEWKEQYGQVIT